MSITTIYNKSYMSTITTFDSNTSMWAIRQNPGTGINQQMMKKIILEQEFIMCPFGQSGNYRNRVIDGIYNIDGEFDGAKSSSQDKTFVENMAEGDIVVIKFSVPETSVIAVVTSEIIYAHDTGCFIVEHPDKSYTVSVDELEGSVPFRPVARKIRVFNNNVTFSDKRQIGSNMATLSRIQNERIKNVILGYIN